MLIIDEPENHFHEELLVKFIKLLNQIVSSKDYVSIIQSEAKKLKANITPSSLRELKKYYENYALSQIFLLTHSKNLIYNNFTSGSNFYLDNSLIKIEYDSFEQTLRRIGLSSIYSKVLFVEGVTETDYFDLFFNEFNIKTHSLGGCNSVIETYKRILEIKSHLRDYHFCFLIDKDTRSEGELEKLRIKNSLFFDEHFIVLERHEFENYLLDPNIYKDVIDSHKSINNEIQSLTLPDIENIIKTFADTEKKSVIRKTINNKNWDSFDALRFEVIKKDIPLNDEESYEQYFDTIFANVNMKEFLLSKFKYNYLETFETLSEEKWSIDWIKLCDGKIVLNKVVEHFAGHLEITRKRLRKEIKSLVLKSAKNYKIKEVINDVLLKFK